MQAQASACRKISKTSPSLSRRDGRLVVRAPVGKMCMINEPWHVCRLMQRGKGGRGAEVRPWRCIPSTAATKPDQRLRTDACCPETITRMEDSLLVEVLLQNFVCRRLIPLRYRRQSEGAPC